MTVSGKTEKDEKEIPMSGGLLRRALSWARDRFVRPMNRRVLGIVLLSASLTLAACGGGGGGGGGAPPPAPGTVDVTFQVRFPGPGPGGIAPLLTKDPTAVQSVGVLVTKTSGGALVQAETELTFNGLVWSGTLTGLPVGESLDFLANAYDGLGFSGNVIYTDLVTQTLSEAGPNDITFNMVAIDLGPGSIPVVASVSMPATIQTGTGGHPIEISILYGGLVDYTVSVALGTLDDVATPGPSVSGTHDPATGPLALLYAAPASSGPETITITLVDAASPGGSFTVVYPITLTATATASMVVNFGPAITALNFSRTATTLTVSATTFGDPLTYAWSGTGSFLALAGSAPSVTIDPFDDTMAGDVILTVTDGGGLTAAVTHPVAAGDFPYDLITTYTPLADSLTLYEDFSGGLLGTSWSEPRFHNIMVDAGVLRMSLEALNHTYVGRDLRFLNPGTILGMAADVSINGFSVDPAANGHIDLAGTFYNDGSGDIVAMISLDHQGNAYFVLMRDYRDNLLNTSLGTITPGITHILELSWDGGTVFTPALDGAPAGPFDASTVGAPYVAPAGEPSRALSIAGIIGQYTALVDNVQVDTGPGFVLYDDFSAPDGGIDIAKWEGGETSGNVGGGRWNTLTRDATEELGLRTPTLIRALAADVTVDFTSGDGRALLAKAFYHDGSNNAIFGSIGLTGSEAIASVLAITLDVNGEPSGSLELARQVLGTVSAGTTHTLYLGWNGQVIDFQLDQGLPLSVDPVTMGYPVLGEIDFAGLMAGPFNESVPFGTSTPGGVLAHFGNVRVATGSPIDATLPSGGIITGVWASCVPDPFSAGSHFVRAETSGQELRVQDDWFLSVPDCSGGSDFAQLSTARFFSNGTKNMLSTGELVTRVDLEWTGDLITVLTADGAAELNSRNAGLGAYGYLDWTAGLSRDVTGLDETGAVLGGSRNEQDIFYIDTTVTPNLFDIGDKLLPADPQGYPEERQNMNLERQP
jgi:hypothetical protein